jgi:glycosyltransferase involved in cell wall biosynthesis
MENQPLVSIIISVHNCARYLGESIGSALSQSYRPFEVIVVDDGSTDRSAEVAKSFEKVCYFYQENQGVSGGRNTGIAMSRGEFIAFLDADDIWEPDKLDVQLAYMKQHPNIGITATKYLNFLEPGTLPPAWMDLKNHLGEVSTYIPSTWMVRRQTIEEVGVFSLDYRAAEDTEWLRRARDLQVAMEVIPHTLARRRFHGTNLSWQEAHRNRSHILKILRESLTRRKTQP